MKIQGIWLVLACGAALFLACGGTTTPQKDLGTDAKDAVDVKTDPGKDPGKDFPVVDVPPDNPVVETFDVPPDEQPVDVPPEEGVSPPDDEDIPVDLPAEVPVDVGPEVAPHPFWCRLQTPLTLPIQAGGEGTVFGRVRLDGVTDKTDKTDEDPDLLGQVGYGPDGSDPAVGEAWVWVDAAGNASWNAVTGGEPGVDEYKGFLMAPGPGTYDYAYRFSKDAGETWLYCDGPAGAGSDGSEDGYQPANAGAMTVSPKPGSCVPNPCTKPPAATCDTDGVTKITYPSPGTCTVVDEKAQCDYPPQQYDCSLDAKICKQGSCGKEDDPCDPNPCMDAPAKACDPDGKILTYYSELGDCSVQDGKAECDYLSNTIDCTLDDLVCTDGACVPPTGEMPRDPGDLVVTEFMARSTTGTDYGEWVEVYNATDRLLDLDGCVLKDDGSNLHTLAGTLNMAPGTYKVLARSGNPAQNFGLPADYVYSNFTLANDSDQIVITCKGVEIDRVTYTSKEITVGASTQLSAKAYDAAANDLPENWCFGKTAYGTDGKLGTPGAANYECKTQVDWCRFQAPLTASVKEGGSVDFSGRVSVAGVTDLTPKVDADPLLKGQVGYGPDGSEPDGNADWTWADAAGNDQWDGTVAGEPANDEYVATVTLAKTGTYDAAFRFSYDGGTTWTYCDGPAGEGSDGSEDGYQVANAGNLVVASSTDPCDPNPCVTPDAPACKDDGKTLVTYDSPGTCIVDAGQPDGFRCDYTSKTTDCTLDAKVCSAGACVVPVDPCNPNPCTKPLAATCDTDGKVATTYASPGTCTVEAGAAKCDYVPATEDCAAAGKDCKDGACVAKPIDKPAAQGDVLVTEFMARAVSGTDNGEWVEVYNNTKKTLDLDGCILKDDGTNAHPIAGPLTFGPGESLVLARSKDPAANYGVPYDYIYANFSLANDGDSIILRCGEVEIDRVVYKKAQVILATAWQLGASSYDATKNDDMANWCPATKTYGTAGKLGTPGDTNDSCKSVVDWCRLQWPLTATAKEGDVVDFYGRVYVAGLTDKTTKVDADDKLKGQAGFGPDGSNPDLDPNWTWVDAIGNSGWDGAAAGEPNNDEYKTNLVSLKAGTFDTAFRFSYDSGKTWIYCDIQAGAGKDGSEDGYDPANAGAFVVASSDPCTPNPCTKPDKASCTGSVLTEYETPGTCTVDAGAAKCAYTPKATDCAQQQKACKDGACVTDPCLPNPCTTPPAAACDNNGKVLTWYEATGTCTDNAGTADCAYPPKTTDCTTDGKICSNAACVAETVPQPAAAGDVIVTEFMARAIAGTDNAEWVEVYNTTQKKLDLGGCVLKDDGTDAHTIAGPLVVEPGKYLVLAKSSDPVVNFGLPFDYKYSSFNLVNTGDQIIVKCGDIEIDRVAYQEAQVILATALQLSTKAYSATANDDMANWCPATAKYGNNGTQDLLGTPKAANAECKNTVGWCRFQHPLTLSITEGNAVDTYGRLHVAGVTDKTKAVDADPRLRAQAGYGTDGTDPATDASWKWVTAAANATWDDTVGGEPGNDEYQAKLTLVPVGKYDTAYRFSMDWGRTWTYCDGPAGPGADGSENGYQAANAGELVVNPKADPCTPNPCNTPTAASCDAVGKVLTTYEAPGTCTVVGSTAKCDYTAKTTDCTLSGKICKDAACVVPPDPCSPNPCTVPPAASCSAVGNVLTTYDATGTCTNNGGTASCNYNPKTTDCTLAGKVCKTGACVVSTGWAAGDLVITEFMARAGSGTDYGEWVEVYNASTRTLDLGGCVLRDDGTNTHTITGPLTVEAGKYLVLAQSGDAVKNYGLPQNYVYGADFALSNSGKDQIVIQCNGVEIDRLEYSEDQVVLGTALQLSSKSYTATANDNMAAWCPATANYGTDGKLGTPGAANAECRNVVDWCRLQHPLSLALKAGATNDVYGRVYVAGVTPKTNGVDADPRLRAEVGWGPDGSAPDGNAAWAWLKASANTGWDAATAKEPNNDEYVATMTALAEGKYDFAYRFSMDWGKTWKYCDGPAGVGKDGSEDGYAAANAGDLVVSAPTPCDPNPCTVAPVATCDVDGKVLTTYTAPGTCEVVGSTSKCTYPSTPTDCTLSGKVCKLGECVVAGAATPSVAGEIVVTEFMPRSISGTDHGEWVELYNPSSKSLDLKGCILKDDSSNTHTIASSVVVASKGYVVLAMSSDPLKNWGLPKVDYAYGVSDFVLSNSGTDQIVVVCGGLEIDRVKFGSSQVVLATARQLDGNKLSAALNDDAATNWCAATAKYGNNGTADVLGTPGTANAVCP